MRIALCLASLAAQRRIVLRLDFRLKPGEVQPVYENLRSLAKDSRGRCSERRCGGTMTFGIHPPEHRLRKVSRGL